MKKNEMPYFHKLGISNIDMNIKGFDRYVVNFRIRSIC